MSQAGYTPIQLYLSTTASAVPSAGNLANGELAINITDGKLFYKDNGGVVQVLATKGAGTIGGSNTQVQYNSSGALAGSANLTFDGTTLTAAGLAGPHNGTVGATTPNTGAFTTLSASSTVSGAGFSTYLASPPAIGGTAANTGAFTTLAASGAVTLSGGTANGVPYLNGSKVLTTGTGLQFDGSNLGLGVTPSAWAANSQAIQNSSGAFWQYGGGNVYVGQNYYLNSGLERIYSTTGAAATEYQQGGGGHRWYTAPSGTAGNAISFTQAMTLDASGNLVIGNTSATAAFDVYRASDAYMALRTGSAEMTFNTGTGFTGGTATSIWNKSAIPMVFGTDNTERARIDSSGNWISSAPITPPTLATNGTMVFNLTSNTNLRVSVRGSDGVTRVANITLA